MSLKELGQKYGEHCKSGAERGKKAVLSRVGVNISKNSFNAKKMM